MGAFLLGMDYGTGGAKVCVIDTQGQVLGFAFEEYPLIHAHPGWSEHDAGRYWQAACRLIPQAIAQARVDAREMRGVAVSSALPSLVLVGRAGQPLANAYNLMDRRATEEVAWLRERFGDELLFQISGNRLEDHPTLVNLVWEQRHRPDLLRRVDKALTIDGYLTRKLTGVSVLHHSGAGFYGPAYNLRRRRFQVGLLEDLGLEPEIMPALHDCTEIIGEVTSQAAAETGLAPGTPVAAGQVDCNAGWVGAGAIAPGAIQSNLGSVGNFGVVHGSLDFVYSPVGYAMINCPYTVDSAHNYVTIPTTMTGGLSIRYLRDQFAQAEAAAEKAGGPGVYDLLNVEAERVPPGCEGLLVLPFLMGERTPIWDVQARGVVFGLSLQHGRGHLVRAMMEAVAYAMYDSYRLIRQAGLPIHLPLVLNEGGAVSRLWRQIIADVFDAPVVLVKRRTGAPYGDAILAGVATGVLPDFGVAQQWAEYVEPMEPDAARHALYMDYFALYKRLYEHVREDFQELARLRG